ncbi:MAG: hypothetical protein HC906_01005 [Bacteroidales bacterium]|nr:hypothetical protein [Bacteroidales bacterium]
MFAGPSVNFLLTEYDSDASEIAPDWSYTIRERNNKLQGWFGFNAGLRFAFF